MKALDDIERRARAALHSEPNPYSLSDTFARTLLAMLPVVRAADAWRSNLLAGVHGYTNKYADKVLKDAVAEMRRALGGES